MIGISTRGLTTPKIWKFNNDGLTKADEGKPVKIAGNDTVALSGADEPFIGTVNKVESVGVTVVLKGDVWIPYTGTAPVVGPQKFNASGTGAIKAVTGTAGVFETYLVLEVDTANSKVRLYLNNC